MWRSRLQVNRWRWTRHLNPLIIEPLKSVPKLGLRAAALFNVSTLYSWKPVEHRVSVYIKHHMQVVQLTYIAHGILAGRPKLILDYIHHVSLCTCVSGFLQNSHFLIKVVFRTWWPCYIGHINFTKRTICAENLNIVHYWWFSFTTDTIYNRIYGKQTKNEWLRPGTYQEELSSHTSGVVYVVCTFPL